MKLIFFDMYIFFLGFNEKTHLILSRVECAIKACANITFENIQWKKNG